VDGPQEIRNLVIRARGGPGGGSPGGSSGDALEAFGELVKRFQDMAYGYAYSILTGLVGYALPLVWIATHRFVTTLTTFASFGRRRTYRSEDEVRLRTYRRTA